MSIDFVENDDIVRVNDGDDGVGVLDLCCPKPASVCHTELGGKEC